MMPGMEKVLYKDSYQNPFKKEEYRKKNIELYEFS